MVYLVAVVVTLAFFFTINAHHQPGPGNPGIDENAYLVAGRNLAHRLQMGMRPETPYAYIGPMWVRGENGWYYPKYPAGVPVLNAVAIWLTLGKSNFAACYVSPVCAAMAVLGMFLLARLVAGSFLGLLAAIILAVNPTLLHLSLVRSSHAPAIAFAVWGMYLLLCWWHTGHIASGIAAGLVLGFTTTIRYSEGLLVLPLALACVTALRWTNWRSWLRAAVPGLAWAVPVVTLLLFNRLTLGHWTGYDPTNESEGFGMEYFRNKWEFTIQQLHMYGLFLTLPLGVVGMLMMPARSWKVALAMLLWFVPGSLLYAAYYWSSPGLSYLRFFLSLYPPVIASAMWLLAVALRGMREPGDVPAGRTWRSALSAVPARAALCAFVGLLVATGIYVGRPDLERQYVVNGNQAYSARRLLAAVPAARSGSGNTRPVLLTDEGGGMGLGSGRILYLQFAADGEWYTTNSFVPRGGRFGFGRGGGRFFGGNQPDDDAPRLFDPARSADIEEAYRNMTADDLAREEKRVLGEAIDSGRGAYAILSPDSASMLRRRLSNAGFEVVTLDSWKEPLSVPTDTLAGPQGGPPPGQFDRGRGGPGGFGQRGVGTGNPPTSPFRGAGPSRFMGRNMGGLAPQGFGMMRGGPQSWEVVKITRKETVAGK